MININSLSKFQRERVYSVILNIIHKYVDRRARIKNDNILYSICYDYNTGRSVKKEMSSKSIYLLFFELYPNRRRT